MVSQYSPLAITGISVSLLCLAKLVLHCLLPHVVLCLYLLVVFLHRLGLAHIADNFLLEIHANKGWNIHLLAGTVAKYNVFYLCPPPFFKLELFSLYCII